MPGRLVAVPVYNEEPYIARVMERIRSFHGGDILAINDGSPDRSGEILRTIPGIGIISHPLNKGYGSSLIDAFDHAIANNYDQLVTIDCDEQHEPRHIPELFRRLDRGGVDIVSCSRYLEASTTDDAPPKDRFAINRRITEIINGITGYGLTDSFCGMKGYRVAALAPFRLTENGYAFPLQFWVQAFHFGLTIEELPIARIYKNLNRTFGGELDDPQRRLNHYLDVLRKELARWSISLPSELIPTI